MTELAHRTQGPPIQLDIRESSRKVMITPQDNDRFLLTVDAAIEACKIGVKHARGNKQFHELLEYLAAWIKAHLPVIKSAYLTVQDPGLLFVVVRKARAHDAHFEDELTKLDLEIGSSPHFDLLKVGVIALPNSTDEAVSHFLCSQTLEFRYAQHG